MRCTVWLLLLSLACAGCVDPFEEAPAPEADGWLAPDSGGPCADGQKRCAGQSLQRCQGSKWLEQQRCAQPKVCVADRGCLGCDPSRGTTCQGNAVHSCSKDGQVGALVKQCLGLRCEIGTCRAPKCALGSRLVYVVDSTYRLLSFDPAKESNHFTLIAKLACPAGSPWPGRPGPATPFSMSVDRSARAWVLYTSGELFWVDTKDGACKPTPFAKGQQGFQLFGMGFVSDTVGSSAEKVYVSRAKVGLTGSEQLGHIDPATLKLKLVGSMPKAEYSAELSGTSKAELFAYFPGLSSTFVAKVDKATGKPSKSWPLPSVGGQVTAWAFAHWGGKFYIFVTATEGLTERSRVLRLDPAKGKTTTFLHTIPYRIVGAGVSTCAPVID